MAILDGSDPLESLRAAICETVYKHPGMPEEALAQRFRMLNPRTLGWDSGCLASDCTCVAALVYLRSRAVPVLSGLCVRTHVRYIVRHDFVTC